MVTAVVVLKVTVPELEVKVPLFVQLPWRVKPAELEALKIPAMVTAPVMPVVGSLVFKSKVPAVTFKAPSIVKVPEPTAKLLLALFTVRL